MSMMAVLISGSDTRANARRMGGAAKRENKSSAVNSAKSFQFGWFAGRSKMSSLSMSVAGKSDLMLAGFYLKKGFVAMEQLLNWCGRQIARLYADYVKQAEQHYCFEG